MKSHTLFRRFALVWIASAISLVSGQVKGQETPVNAADAEVRSAQQLLASREDGAELRALQHATRALALFGTDRSLRSLNGKARAMDSIAVARSRQREERDAIAWRLRASRLFAASGDVGHQREERCKVAFTYWATWNDVAQALPYARLAANGWPTEKPSSAEDLRQRVDCAMSLGGVFAAAADYELAEQFYREVAALVPGADNGGEAAGAHFWSTERVREARLRSRPQIVLKPVNMVSQSIALQNKIAYSPDGGWILTAVDSTLRGLACLWSAESRQLVQCFPHFSNVEAVAFSPDSREFVSASVIAIDVRSATTLKLLKRLILPRSVSALSFSPDGAYLFAGSVDGTVRVVSRKNWLTIRTFCSPDSSTLCTGSNSVTALAVGDNGALIVGYKDGRTVWWDWQQQTVKREWRFTSVQREVNKPLLGPAVRRLALSPIFRQLAAVLHDDGTAQLLDLSESTPLQCLDHRGMGCKSSAPVEDDSDISPDWETLSFTPDGSGLITAGDTDAIWWDVAHRPALPRQLDTPDDGVDAIASSKGRRDMLAILNSHGTAFWNPTKGDLQYLYTSTEDEDKPIVIIAKRRREIIWADSSGLVHIFSIDTSRDVERKRFTPEIVGLKLCGDERHLLVTLLTRKAGKSFKEVVRWDLDSSELTAPVQFPRHGTLLDAVDTRVLVGIWDKHSKTTTTASQINLDTGDIMEMPIPGGVLHAALIPNGLTAFVQTKDERSVIAWDLESNNQKFVVPHPDVVRKFAVSRDGKVLFTYCSSGLGYLWDANTGKLLHPMDLGRAGPLAIISVSFSNSRVLVAGEGIGAQLWDIKRGIRVKWVAKPDGDIVSVQLVDDKHVLTAGVLWQFWDVDAEEVVSSMSGLGGDAEQSVVLSEGARLLAIDFDGTVHIYDLPSGDERGVLVFTPEGTWTAADVETGEFDSNTARELHAFHWLFPREGATPIPPEVFVRDYFHPGLFLELVAGRRDHRPPPVSTLNILQPKVSVTSVVINANKSTADVTVEVTQRTRGARRSGGYDLRLIRDGRVVGTWPEVRLTAHLDRQSWRKATDLDIERAGRAVHTFRDVRLPRTTVSSTTTLSAYAFNNDRVKSENALPKVAALPNIPGVTNMQRRPRAYVIGFAVDLNNSGWNLDFAAENARRVTTALGKIFGDQYDVVIVNLLSVFPDDKHAGAMADATKQNLRLVLSALANGDLAFTDKLEQADLSDIVVLYVCAHGYADPSGNLHIIPRDTPQNAVGITEAVLNRCLKSALRTKECNDARRFLSETISVMDLETWWAPLDAGEMAVILDTCHSGAITEPGFRPAPLGDPGFGQLAFDKRMLVFAASQRADTITAGLSGEQAFTPTSSAILSRSQLKGVNTLSDTLADVFKRLLASPGAPGRSMPLYLDFEQ
jgi:WD40 repeat protein